MRKDQNEWTEKRLQAALKDVTNSYNNTVNRHGFKPASVNSPEFDPFLREKLYGKDTKLERFETFYNEQLRLGKKANTPRKSAKIPFKEGPNDFRKVICDQVIWF